jgi:hypothetical protein
MGLKIENFTDDALAPIATKAQTRRNVSDGANNGREQSQQTNGCHSITPSASASNVTVPEGQAPWLF